MEALTTHLSGFGGGCGVEGGKVFQRLFEFRFGLGGVAIFLFGRGGGSIYVLSVLSVGCLVHDGRNVLGRRGINRLRLRRRLLRWLCGGEGCSRHRGNRRCCWFLRASRCREVEQQRQGRHLRLG